MRDEGGTSGRCWCYVPVCTGVRSQRVAAARPGTGERCEKAPLLWSAPWERHVR